ncbi:YncE family protein [Mitsuaria sp. 7]|uniref:YncE family protein n=1 Tax=Mitsuaria sp. 7 TaxID=1658665 RepID=UPI0007DE1E78|nr:hypothetical protein [Mitsuaria sp. 7]ANH69178.1 hypothetical protein ABE85_19305 [Mitsuaria sp. 7]
MKRLRSGLAVLNLVVLTACGGDGGGGGSPAAAPSGGQPASTPVSTVPDAPAPGASTPAVPDQPASTPVSTDPTAPSQPDPTTPPVTQPPVTQPPVTQPPVTQPPVTQPPVTQPPVTQPPVTQPPVTQPPVTQPPVTTYAVGGTVTGLIGPGLVLRLNNAADLAVETDRAFSFSAGLPSGTAYTVTVQRQPPRQNCTVQAAGSGTLASDVASVRIACALISHPPMQLNVSGTVNGLKGSGLVLALGSQQIAVPAGATSFAFPTPWNTGQTPRVSVVSHPTSAGQRCLATSPGANSGPETANITYIDCVDTAPLSTTPGLTVDRASVDFVAEEGETPAPQTVRGTVQGTTPATVTVQVTNSGMAYGYYTTLSPQAGMLVLSPKSSLDLAPGVYRDTVTVKACEDAGCTRQITGSPRTVDVTYTIKPRQTPRALLPALRGVAFAVTPSGSSTTRSIVVRESSGTSVPWQAVSDAAWLLATPSGASNGSLILTANAAGLTDGFHEATVSLTSTTPGVRASAIRVGLYKSGQASATTVSNQLPNVNDYSRPGVRVVDPVRPLIYSAVGDTIAAHHLYGGQRAATLTLTGIAIADLAVSGDGRRLYVLDDNNTGITVIDAATLTVVRQNALQANYRQGKRIAAAHIAGEDLLVLTEAEMPIGETIRMAAPVLRAETGLILGEVREMWRVTPAMLQMSGDGRVLYAGTIGTSGYLAARRFDLRANGKGMFFGVTTGISPELNVSSLQDLAVNQDGSRVVVSYSTQPVPFVYRFDGSALVQEAAITPFSNNSMPNYHTGSVKFDIADRLFMNNANQDVRVYRADGTLQNQWLNVPYASVWTTPAGTLRLSSDGLRMIGGNALADAP